MSSEKTKKFRKVGDKLAKINVIDKYRCERRNRNYYLIDTPLGRYVYYTMEADNHETAAYKNITLGDIFWSYTRLDTFQEMFEEKPIHTFVSERLIFPRERIKVDCGSNGVYHLAEPRKKDGFLYEIPTSDLHAFPTSKYPDKKFVYTRYNISSLKTLDKLDIERLKTEEVVRFNGGFKHSVNVVSTIVDEVYRYIHMVPNQEAK